MKPTTEVALLVDGTRSFSALVLPEEEKEHVAELELLDGWLDSSRLEVIVVRA